MREFWTKIWSKLKNPPTWAKVINFVSTILLATASLLTLVIDYSGSLIEIFVYILFALSAISLTYSVYLIVIIAPKIKKATINALESRNFTHLLLRNYGFRTVIFAIGSFLISVVFSVFNGYMGIVNRSIWYGALATYYIALAFLRGGILTYHRRKISKTKKQKLENDDLTKAKVYRDSGIILLIFNVALSSAIAQMIFSNAHFTYIGLTIFAYAAYAFYKITMSIINLFRANKQPDLTIKAIRNVNLADATVSILGLQTALLTMFADGNIDISLMNTFTGCAVSIFSVGLGIYMIVSANKKIKELRKEKNDNE